MRTLYKFLRAGVVSALFVQVGFAQKENVGIGTTKPDQSAILDLSSTNKGLLMPRVSLQQRNNIQNPANGLIVYQTDMLSGFYYYDGKEWKSVGSETAQNSVADAFNWGLTGNAGTNPATNFIGTTDNQPLVLRVNNQRAGFFDNSTYDNLFLGSGSGISNVTSGTPTSPTSGGLNVGLGTKTLQSNTTGAGNTAIGSNALLLNTTGYYNTAIGFASLFTNSTGAQNINIGSYSGFSSNGNNNIGIGIASLQTNATGSQNIGIGTGAGYSNAGSNSIFLGFQAGYNEMESNKLYIANSNTTTPLIYGDFAAKYLAVGEISVSERNAATTGGYRLLVKGGMITEKIKVAVASSTDWADYVFEPSYKLMSLDKVESFVKENKHLPNVPSAEEMAKNGLDVTLTSAKLMEKIEELTLYMIELNKEVKALKAENEKLKK